MLGCLLWQFQSNAQDNFNASKENTELAFRLDANGTPVYSVLYKHRAVIKPSTMGFSLDVDSTFNAGFAIINTEKKQQDDSWHPVWGEESTIRDNYEELTVHLRHRSGRLLDIVFPCICRRCRVQVCFSSATCAEIFCGKRRIHAVQSCRRSYRILDPR
jgi:hypothetical protein